MAQFIIAVYGGYFGAGIGILMLASLAFAGLDNIHHANGLKVLLSALINAVASIVFLLGSEAGSPGAAFVDWKVAAAMAIGSAGGGFAGMAVARRIERERLRAIILIIGALLTGAFALEGALNVAGFTRPTSLRS